MAVTTSIVMGNHVLNWRATIQWVGLFAGPTAAGLAFLCLPEQYLDVQQQHVPFTTAGRLTLSVMTWMAIWWITEAVDISSTALLPLVLLPILGATTMREASAPYADPLIFLFLGGFLIAIAMQRWGLDRRLALLTLRMAGTRPANMVAGFMVTTAALSAFVSNTATTAMMVPIALSVVSLVRRGEVDDSELSKDNENLAVSLLLGIAYAASIGGIATIIGTPPNALFVGFVSSTIPEAYRTEITFDRWLSVGLPVTLVMLPITWLLLTKILFRVGVSEVRGGRELIREELLSLGSLHRGERVTLIVFLVTAVTWIVRPLLVAWRWHWGSETLTPFAGLTDAGIAMTGAMLLFLIPIQPKQRVFALDWSATSRLPWGILILFGGGLSLAGAVQRNGVAEFIGSLAHHTEALPPVFLVVVITSAVILLTEMTSNAATTATLLPILAALAPGLGLHPYLLILPATIAASCAFMMPVATPPNAIVFGSGEVQIRHMVKAGIWLNIVGVIVISLLTMLWYRRLFGI
jgi:sodium-dependent dicarboxylate transporter 2/3/5